MEKLFGAPGDEATLPGQIQADMVDAELIIVV
jgi:hypothetical protein